MSDETSAPRGRYAQPRRRRHAQKSRQRLDSDQSSYAEDVAGSDGADFGRSESPEEFYDDRDERLADDAYDDGGDGDYGDAPDGAPARYDDRYAFDDDADSDARPTENAYDHDYLDREGARSNFSPDQGGYDAARDYAEAPDDPPYAPPARARSYDALDQDGGAYERRPLRDRSLPPPPEDAALVGAPVDVGDDVNLIVSGIGKSYKRRPVVRDVSLEVRRGEIVGLLGPNGAGKTTCFYMITGLVPADRGSIQLMGRDLTRLPMYQRARMGLSYLPQEVSIFRGMTVEQNIRAILELSEPSPHRRDARLDQLLAEFSISRLRNSPAIALSGGERRRVEIARCLAADPAFILLDEPFAGVDPIAVGDIRSLVWQLKDRGIGVLITDHNVRETLEIIDRAYILHDGRVLMEGAPEDVINDENVRRVYLGEGFRI